MRKKVRFKTEEAVTTKGWSQWIKPKMKKYLIKCCDCGLVHEMKFRVVVDSAYDGKKWSTVLNDSAFAVEFRTKRRKRV